MTSASRKLSQGDIRLDALFDYSRVRPQRIDLDDDDEDVQIVTPAKPKTASGYPVKSSDSEVGKENLGKCDKEVKVVNDDDWLLPPPPPSPLAPLPIAVDPALLKIRQQKLELEHMWQDSVKNVEEASRLEARVTVAASPQQSEGGKREGGACEAQSNSKRQKILLKLQGESGESHGVRIFVDEKLDKLFTHYAKNLGKRPTKDLVFRFDGVQLDPNSSPNDLELEDEDIVEVFVKKT